VPELARTADVIVLGQITSTRQVGVASLVFGAENVPSRVLTADLHVREVLKGAPATPDITVQFLLPDDPIGYRTPPVGTSAIFFLNRTGQEYRFASPYRPFIAGMPAAMPEGGALLDRLVNYVRAAIDSTETRPDLQVEAIFALGEIPGELATQALQSASNLSNPDLRLSAAAALLMRNDISRLQVAADVLLAPAGGQSSELRQNLLAGVSEGVRDPEAVPILARLLAGGDDRVRVAAASALGRTASPNAIAALARALDDPEIKVRYTSVVGLANIARQPDWKPNADDFRDREARYLSYWKEWTKRR
jgi:hypothetical protein